MICTQVSFVMQKKAHFLHLIFRSSAGVCGILKGWENNCRVKGGAFLLNCQCFVLSPLRMLLMLLGKVIYLILPLYIGNFSQSSGLENNSPGNSHKAETDHWRWFTQYRKTPLLLCLLLCTKNIHQLFVGKLFRWLHFILKSDVAAGYLALVTAMPGELVSSSERHQTSIPEA